jgi:uncharacterized protein (DUF433 family)
MRDYKHEYDLAQLSGQLKKRRPEILIRDTKIKVMEVYRSLTWGRLSEKAILDRYPELRPDDIPAVREVIRAEIRSRDHDEITGRPILRKGQLADGRYYKGRCRNATIARWNASENCFYHWREKFGKIYIETIKYPTDEEEPWWDVFDVVEELPDPKFEIPFDNSAEFQGRKEHLREFDREMWEGWQSLLKGRGLEPHLAPRRRSRKRPSA